MLKTKNFHKNFIKYSFYLLVLLIILDVVSTYLGIKYFNLYEANVKTARLFEALGILVPSGLKIAAVILFGYIIKLTLKHLDSLMHDTNGWMNSLAIISSLNITLVILMLNVVYFIVDLHNLNLLYAYL
ncbi:Uncharacterised protein [uncultured archaeon]|nr:Uncharacterised protein [uncultured archaeon]